MLDILYKRAKTGKVLSYEIRVEHKPAVSVITKYTGQLHGQKTTHTEPIISGKQGRTVSQQAEFMALSDWKKKKDSGYKSLTDLGITKVEDLDKTLPLENTDASGNVKPMLAHEFHKHEKKVKYPVYVQPKFDGVRCLSVCTITQKMSGKSVDVKFLSRTGKPYTTLSHIEQDLVKYLQTSNLVGLVVLDGEIYSDELTFQEIVSAVKALKPISAKLKYRVYDIVNNERQDIRRVEVSTLVTQIGSSHIMNTETFSVNSKDEIVAYFSHFVSQGYEGLMVRQKAGMYESGSRSYSLLKYKEFDDAEFDLQHFEIGAREEDLIAVYLYNGKEFKAKMMGTAEEKQVLRTREIKKGTKLTVKFFGFTDDGIPRFPIGKEIRDYE